MPTRHRLRLAAALIATTFPLAACSEAGPLDVPGSEVRGGAVGPDEAVTEDLKVLQVQIEYPLDGVYEEGENARLFLGIANTGGEPDELVDVIGEEFTAATLTAGGDPGAIPVPGNDNVYVGAEGGPTILLEGLERTLRSSQSIPVTLVFQEAGEVTLDVPVAAEGQNPTPTFDFPDPAEDATPDD
jgi:copper(I)-binding protein